MSVLVGNPPTWQKLYAGSRFASSVLPCGRILGHCNNPALPFCLVCGRGISAQILAWKSETRRAVLLQCLKILLAWFRARISAGQSNLYTFYDPPSLPGSQNHSWQRLKDAFRQSLSEGKAASFSDPAMRGNHATLPHEHIPSHNKSHGLKRCDKFLLWLCDSHLQK